jgi:hypothetical protein
MWRMCWIVSLSLLLAAVAAAQPPVPFTVLTADSGAAFSSLHLAMRDTATCDVFYLRNLTNGLQRIEHAVVSLTQQRLLQPPEILLAQSGWQPTIGDAQSNGSRWAVLIYEATPYRTNISLNRTSLVWGLDTMQGSAVLDTSRWYEYLIWGVVQSGDHWNTDFTLRTTTGGHWLANWIVESVSGQYQFYEQDNFWHTSRLAADFSSLEDYTQSCHPFQFGPSHLRTAIVTNTRVFGLLGNAEMFADNHAFVFGYRDDHQCRGRDLDSTLNFFDLWSLYDAHFMMLAQEITTPAAWKLYDMDTTGQCVYLNSLQLPDIAATSWQPNIGMAAIQVTPQVIMLARHMTSGRPVWPPGVFYESGPLHRIREANTALSTNRRVIIFWSESDIDSAQASVLKMARVGWSTFLGVDDPRVIPQPSSFALSAFPNPFNPRTELQFSLPEASKVALRVYDLQGRLSQELIRGRLERGEHRVSFDARDLPSGLYFARLTAGWKQATQKLLLVK